jgi:hypothetical protein
MKRKLSETSKDPTFEEDDSLPPGQMRDEKGVVWQVGDQDKNPFADWAPPQLAEDQIMDERGVIWQARAGSVCVCVCVCLCACVCASVCVCMCVCARFSLAARALLSLFFSHPCCPCR